MGGGTSIVGLGRPGVNDELGAGIVGRLVAGISGAESTGDGDPGATHAAIDHATTGTRRSRTTVRIRG
jgi:hypothetical protein